MKAVYPGSFDPVTLGHIDIIRRAARICSELTVGVLINTSKNPMFSMEERVEMLEEAVGDLPGVKVECFSGLTADFVKAKGADVMIRGLRGSSDFDSEMSLANGNRAIAPELDTVFFITDPSLGFISSSTAKEIAYYGGDISKFVPPFVQDKIKEKIMEMKK